MLTLQWVTSGAAIVVAVLAFLRARQLSRRLDRLTESYWELRYDYGQLRSQLAQLQPSDQTASPAAQEHPAPGQTAFVPLSSLKR